MKKATFVAAVFGAVIAIPFAFAGNLTNPFDGTIGTEHRIEVGENDIPAKPKIVLTFVGNDAKAAKGDPKAKAKFLGFTEGGDIEFVIQTAKGSGFFNVDIKGIGDPGNGAFGGILVNPPNLDKHVFIEAAPGDEITFQGTFFGSKKPKVFVNGKKAKTVSNTQNSVTVRLSKKTPGGAGETSITTKTGTDTANGIVNVIAPIGGKSSISGNFGAAKLKVKASKKSPVVGLLGVGRETMTVVVGDAPGAKPKPIFFSFAMNFGQPIDDVTPGTTFTGNQVNAIQYGQLVINNRIPVPQFYSGGAGDLEVTITNVTATRVSGTFQGTLNKTGGNGPASINVTNGQFIFDLENDDLPQ